MITPNTSKSWSFVAISKYHPSAATADIWVVLWISRKLRKKVHIPQGSGSKYEREPILLLTGAFLYAWGASGLSFHVHLLHQGKPKEENTSLDKGHEAHTLDSRNLDAIFQTEGLEPSLYLGTKIGDFVCIIASILHLLNQMYGIFSAIRTFVDKAPI